DSFDILGHSWGGILATEFEVRRQPAGLRRLVLSNSLASVALRQQSTAQLLVKFPKEVQEGMMAGMTDQAAFYSAFAAFLDVHGCTVKPTPQEVVHTMEQTLGEAGDPTVASAPVVKDWTIIDRLHAVRVPTLVINGRLDYEQDFVVAPLFENIPKAKWVTFEKSSHMPFWEERDRYMWLIEGYLRWDL
ncbi:Alpha/Beta hydrolase protein, partial [Amylostereum chailletii]